MTARIILDTDVAMGAPGSDIDDGFAIGLAVAEPAIDLELVTTVDGNTDVRSATVLALELLARLEHDVPVVQGAAGPLMDPWRPRATALDLDAHRGVVAAPGRAAQAIVDHVLASPGEVTLVAIGPLTNVATAMLLEPRLAEAVAGVVVMGGYFFGQQNDVRVPGEFNIWADPEAAQIVLRSGADVRLVGLDVTYQVRMTQDQAATLATSGSPFGSFAGQCGLAWIQTLRERYPRSKTHGSFHLHDPLAVATLARPDLVEWQPAHVQVALDGVARGITVADTLGTHGAPPANCQIATAVDAPGFVDYLTSTLSAR
ncbi:nucleoside hydrolase [Cellulosimicrobium sp. 22601]|uniref:nucleoside hydrolase n=1 Tax=unclassified Cellulosimicrobium TaxID=2624466 RepID=UPI003F83C53E